MIHINSVFNACIDKRLFSIRTVRSNLKALHIATSGGQVRGVWGFHKTNKSDLLSAERNSRRQRLAPKNRKAPNPCCEQLPQKLTLKLDEFLKRMVTSLKWSPLTRGCKGHRLKSLSLELDSARHNGPKTQWSTVCHVTSWREKKWVVSII
jgi:hypothetical protein